MGCDFLLNVLVEFFFINKILELIILSFIFNSSKQNQMFEMSE